MEDKQLKIHVTNLKKNFGKLEVLKDISMDVHEGEVVVLLGPSGSGKSTLLRCLNQLETATAGQIIIDGHDVTDKHTDINKVRENIGMVFQHFNLFNHLTVLDNMTLAPVHLKLMSKEEAKAEAEEQPRLAEEQKAAEEAAAEQARQAELQRQAEEQAAQEAAQKAAEEAAREAARQAAHRRLVIRLTCVGAFSALVIALAVVLIRKLHKAGRC